MNLVRSLLLIGLLITSAQFASAMSADSAFDPWMADDVSMQSDTEPELETEFEIETIEGRKAKNIFNSVQSAFSLPCSGNNCVFKVDYLSCSSVPVYGAACAASIFENNRVNPRTSFGKHSVQILNAFNSIGTRQFCDFRTGIPICALIIRSVSCQRTQKGLFKDYVCQLTVKKKS